MPGTNFTLHQRGHIVSQSCLKQPCVKVVTNSVVLILFQPPSHAPEGRHNLAKLSQSCLKQRCHKVVPTYFNVHQRGDIVVHLQTDVNRVIFLQVANRQLAEF